MFIAFGIPGTGFDVPPAVLLLGAIAGTSYALFGMGLTLTYQSSRVLNFAQGAMGTVPAVMVATLVLDHGWGYWPALISAILVAGLSGALVEALVIRRLQDAPRLVVLVATIGAAQVLSIPVIGLVDADDTKIIRDSYPTPFDASFTLDGLRFGPGYVLILLVAPLLVIGLTLFLRRTTIGLASRASAENQEAAALSGIPVHRVAAAVWAIAGMLAGAAAILAGPTGSSPVRSLFGGGGASGGELLLFGLGAAMVGGLRSLPQVFVAGVGLGVVRALLDWNTDGGIDLLVSMGIILLSLLLRRDLRQLVRGGEESSWSLAGVVKPLSAPVRRLPRVRGAQLVMLAGLLAVAIVVPLSSGPSQRVLYSAILVYGLVGMSLVILTGWAGQVSLGHFTFVAAGAYVGGRMHQLGYGPSAAIALAIAAGVVIAVVVGLPALRMRGLFLAVTTLAFAVAANAWLFRQSWLVQLSAGTNSTILRRREWGPFDFQDELTYYYLLLVVVVVVALAIYRLRHTGVYRALVAVRDNEPMAAALTISPARTKLLAFVISGALASFAGYLYGMLLVNFGQSGLGSTSNSQLMITMVIVGGSTTVTGAFVGAAYVRGIPYFFPGAVATLLSSGIGLLFVLLFLRGGIASVLFRARDWVVDRLTGPLEEPPARTKPIRLEPRPRAPVSDDSPSVAAIAAEHITKAYGGVVAVNDASLEARQGEIVGLLGPNGAGKTTTFDIVSGLVTPDAGRILLNGHDVTGLGADQRALLGLGRSFQQSRLFDGLSILETFAVALERAERTEVVPTLLTLPPSRAAERDKRRAAAELVDMLGLGAYAERTAPELSTGTRRVAELGCLIALGADVILLDEPTGGIAQREVEAFVGVLRQVRDHLDATMLIVAHDIPMIVSLVDRLYVMASGAVIAEGDPSLLQTNPQVIAAYLGAEDEEPDGSDEESDRSDAPETEALMGAKA